MALTLILAHFGSRYLLNKRTQRQKNFFGEQAPQGVLTMSRIHKYQFWVLPRIVPFSIHSMLNHSPLRQFLQFLRFLMDFNSFTMKKLAFFDNIYYLIKNYQKIIKNILPDLPAHKAV